MAPKTGSKFPNIKRYWAFVRRQGEIIAIPKNIETLEHAESLFQAYPTADKIELFTLRKQRPFGLFIRTKRGKSWGKPIYVSYRSLAS